MEDLKISKLDRFRLIFILNPDFDFRSKFLLYRLQHFSDTCPWSITNGRPVCRSEISKIGTHQKIGESVVCTVGFRFVCGRHHAACQIHNSTAHSEHLATTVTRARCRKQTGGERVRGRSAVGQPTSLIFASYRRSFDVYSGRICTRC